MLKYTHSGRISTFYLLILPFRLGVCTEKAMQGNEFKQIGIIESCFKDKFGTPRQPGLVKNSRAFLRIAPQYQPEFSLAGLEGFTHIWVIFLFHKNTNNKFHAKVHPPRLKGKTMGLFATRSPHRPNPIGLSLVEIDRIEATGLWVRGVDFIDGTPLLDIKPYLPEVESRSYAKGGWSEKAENLDCMVAWSEKAENELELCAPTLKSLVEETLKLDPRPQVYKGYEGEDSPYRESHAIRISNLDVHFCFLQKNQILITDIKTDFR